MTGTGTLTLLRRRIPPVTPVGAFVTVGTGLAGPLMVWSLTRLFTGPVGFGVTRVLVALLLVGVIVGEFVQVEVALAERGSYVLTLSATFVVALLYVAPVGLVILAQIIPLVADDVKHGRHWSRPLFNLAQYVLASTATRAVFCLLTGQAFFEPRGFVGAAVPAALAAALVYMTVNLALVTTVVRLDDRCPLTPRGRASPLGGGATVATVSAIGVTVTMAPVLLAVVDFSIWLAPVLLVPVIAVRTISKLALEHRDNALHDTLTDLPNRSYFQHRLGEVLAERHCGTEAVAVMFLDLDHFKEVNDTLGHDSGDALIREVGHRLRHAVPEDVIVARLGGDEFAVLTDLPADGTPALHRAIVLAERLAGTLDEPISVAGIRLEVHASIGIALAPQHAESSADLLAKADVAMYLAKAGGGGVAVYDPDKDENTTERLLLLTELHDALAADRITVHYQPKCDVRTGTVTGAEALVRWQHPRRGLLAPDAFVPLAETSELISQLTLVVLEQAIGQARSWLDQGHWLSVAVNLPVRHLSDVRLPEQVDALLRRYRVPPALLTLEVTESTVMTDPHRSVAVLAALRACGVRVAVDDYGTGYSSLAYLKRLSVDELKIDRSFVIGLTGDPNNQIIVTSTVDLGHNLGLRVVAEGVEDAGTWRYLQALGCDEMQGHVVHRPMPVAEFDRWLAEWRSDRCRRALALLPTLTPARPARVDPRIEVGAVTGELTRQADRPA